jgi:hypothetical protein
MRMSLAHRICDGAARWCGHLVVEPFDRAIDAVLP